MPKPLGEMGEVSSSFNSSSGSCSTDEKKSLPKRAKMKPPPKRARHSYSLRSKGEVNHLSSIDENSFPLRKYATLRKTLEEMIFHARFQDTILTSNALDWKSLAGLVNEIQLKTKSMFIAKQTKVLLFRDMLRSNNNISYDFGADILYVPNDFWEDDHIKKRFKCFQGKKGFPDFSDWLMIVDAIVDNGVPGISEKGESSECWRISKNNGMHESVSVHLQDQFLIACKIAQILVREKRLNLNTCFDLFEIFKCEADASHFVKQDFSRDAWKLWTNFKIDEYKRLQEFQCGCLEA